MIARRGHSVDDAPAVDLDHDLGRDPVNAAQGLDQLTGMARAAVSDKLGTGPFEALASRIDAIWSSRAFFAPIS